MLKHTDYETSSLAQNITRAGSKQTYFTAQLLVDKNLVNDFYKAYAYFRWVDDFIDVESQSKDERISFVKRQRFLLDSQELGDVTRANRRA